MKVFVSVDMEGVSGLVRWDDVVTRGIDYERNRLVMTRDANAAIEGAFAAGAREVVVEENHGVQDLCNLRLDEIDSRCRVVRGAGRPTATTMSALDSDTGVVLLVGHHAGAGAFPGIMAHTISYERFRAVRLAGREVGEPEIFAIRAGELGVPVGLVTGDQVVAEQLRKRVPAVLSVEVKRALSHVAGDVLPPARAQLAIREAAQSAVEGAMGGRFAPYVGEPAPYEIEVELRQPLEPSLRENLARLPEFEIADEHTVRTLADDMDLGFRRIAYLGYGHAPGQVRY